MVERVKDPWKTSDGKTFASRKEAEKHEGRVELAAWFVKTRACEGDATSINTIVASICADQATFVDLLRKAGVQMIVRERKAQMKPPAEPKEAGQGRGGVARHA